MQHRAPPLAGEIELAGGNGGLGRNVPVSVSVAL